VTLRTAPVPLPDPPLADGHLTLRPWQPADAGALEAAWSDPDIARWTAVPDQPSRSLARRWIQGDADRRARGVALDLVLDVGGAVVGEVGLSSIDVVSRTAEIGWWVAPGHRGGGLAARGASLVARWAIEELCVDTIVARCAPANPASGCVARAAGFLRLPDEGEAELWGFTPVGGATLGT
jgi:RimJ/RimL family protein N-acetyltransferase